MRDIDEVVRTLIALYPETKVEQLQVLHPADDDGIWFFTHPSCRGEVQLEAPAGNCPFALENDQDDERSMATAVDEAVEGVAAKLGLPPVR